MTPVVSIVVTCFNQAGFLERSVKSVLAQTFTDLECIIVDDGSTDDTQQVAEQLKSYDSRVSYYYKENGGVSSSRNFGFKKAQGEWIQFLDGDDWIHEDKIRFQLSYSSQKDNENTAFYADYERVFIDKDQNITQRQENIVGYLTSEQLTKRLLIPDFLANSPFPLLQQCLLMHRSVLEKKMFDEKLKALEDRDFTVDLVALGVNFVYTPIVGAYYTKHQSNQTNNSSYMKFYYILFYEKVISKHKNLIDLCQVGINFLLKEAIREKEHQNFSRLIKLILPPFELLNQRIKIHYVPVIKLLYLLRLITPSFLIYEKARGPRAQKIISTFNQLFGRKINTVEVRE